MRCFRLSSIRLPASRDCRSNSAHQCHVPPTSPAPTNPVTKETAWNSSKKHWSHGASSLTNDHKACTAKTATTDKKPLTQYASRNSSPDTPRRHRQHPVLHKRVPRLPRRKLRPTAAGSRCETRRARSQPASTTTTNQPNQRQADPPRVGNSLNFVTYGLTFRDSRSGTSVDVFPGVAASRDS